MMNKYVPKYTVYTTFSQIYWKATEIKLATNILNNLEHACTEATHVI